MNTAIKKYQVGNLKKSQQQKAYNQMTSLVNSIKRLKKILTQIYFKFFLNKEYFLTHSEISNTSKPKDRTNKRKLTSMCYE